MDFALDIETNGLHPWDNGRVLLITIKGPDGKITQLRGSERDKIMALKPILEDPNHCKIIHRSSFDATWMAVHYGIFITNIFDTKLAETIIQGEGEYAKTGLKDCLIKYKLAKLDKSVVTSFIGQDHEDFTVEQLVYAAADVEFMHKLKAKQEKILHEMGLDTLMSLENKVAEVTYRMRVNGIAFDRKRWMEIADHYQGIYTALESKLDSHFKNIKTELKSKQAKLFETVEQEKEVTIGTKWSSPAQVKKHFSYLGPFVYDDLPKMKGIDPWLDIFIQMNDISKYVTTYGYGWFETERGQTISKDGRVHTDFAQIVSTGRYSSSFPNLQQIPKATEHRSAFIAEKGNVLVSGDFTGQEIAIMAYGSQDEVWLTALREGKDVHSIMAAEFFPTQWKASKEKGCSFPKKCKCKGHLAIRDKAKTYNFGLPYGKTAPTLAVDLGVPVEEAKNTVAKYKTATPDLTAWLKENGNRAIEYSEIRTLEPFSRYRNLKRTPEKWHKRNQGYNTPVQGTGGDMLKLALWYVYEASKKFKTVKVILCVHDEIITECSKKESVKWSQELQKQMERAADFVTEKGLIKVDPKISERWKLAEAD